jgi:hypothetical protein
MISMNMKKWHFIGLPLLVVKRKKYIVLKQNTSLGSKITWARIIGSKLNPYSSKCAKAKKIKWISFCSSC